ncbi:MAG: CHAD domain-containing protein [Actinomycetota bacterium]|nr:CHAD domain-containing protein [Actinomycetota bacterium]
MTATDDGGGPPLEFVEIVWPLSAGHELRPVSVAPAASTDLPTRHLDRTIRRAIADVIIALPWLRVADADPIHVRAARTAVRRLRTHYRAARPVLDGRPATWDGLRVLNDHLRAVRDLDIVERTLPRVHRLARGEPTIGRDADGLHRLLDAVADERRRARNELWAELVHPRTSQLLDQLDDQGELPIAEAYRSTSDAQLALTMLRAQVETARARARDSDDGGRDELMALRTALRRVRVSAAAASAILGEDARRLARRAVEVQDSLGDFADLDKTRMWLDTQARLRLTAGLAAELSRVAVWECDTQAESWRVPWERFTRRRVLRWL